jgi:hypothetical protein
MLSRFKGRSLRFSSDLMLKTLSCGFSRCIRQIGFQTPQLHKLDMGRTFKGFHGTSCNSVGRNIEKHGCSSMRIIETFCSLRMTWKWYIFCSH